MALVKVQDNDEYIDKLVKLVPAEAISAYIALINIATVSVVDTVPGVASNATSASVLTLLSSAHTQVWGAFGIALSILIIARIFGSLPGGPGGRLSLGNVDWIMVVISTIAFFLWVYTIGGSTSGPFRDHYILFWGTALIILFTFLAPYAHSGATRIAREGREKARVIPESES